VTHLLEPIPLTITLYRLENSQSSQANKLWQAVLADSELPK